VEKIRRTSSERKYAVLGVFVYALRGN